MRASVLASFPAAALFMSGCEQDSADKTFEVRRARYLFPADHRPRVVDEGPNTARFAAVEPPGRAFTLFWDSIEESKPLQPFARNGTHEVSVEGTVACDADDIRVGLHFACEMFVDDDSARWKISFEAADLARAAAMAVDAKILLRSYRAAADAKRQAALDRQWVDSGNHDEGVSWRSYP